MNTERIKKLIEELSAIAEEESLKPVLKEGQGVQRAINCGKIAAVQDILLAIVKDQP